MVGFFFKKQVFNKKRKRIASVQEGHACGGSECQSVSAGAACPCIWAELGQLPVRSPKSTELHITHGQVDFPVSLPTLPELYNLMHPSVEIVATK